MTFFYKRLHNINKLISGLYSALNSTLNFGVILNASVLYLNKWNNFMIDSCQVELYKKKNYINILKKQCRINFIYMYAYYLVKIK